CAYQGEQAVKNIAQPVRVYRIGVDIPSPLGGEAQGEEADQEAERQKAKGKNQKAKVKEPKLRRVRPALRWVAVGVVLIAVTILAVRFLPFLFPNTQSLIPSTQALPLPDKPSVAVLPFTNMSGDPSQEHISDGMTEAIITDLSKFSGLFVIARN